MTDSERQPTEPPPSTLRERRGSRHPCPVVGMGASAGGLDAFQAFFARMPPDSGMAFVLIQHLHPRHETLMPGLLARHTSMPVEKVSGRTVVTPNHVYVIPAGATVAIDGCTLCLTQEPGGGRSRHRSPIDSFFRSLAEDQGDDAVGIVLSGAGADGALGLKAIKEHGGLTLVQAPGTTRFDSMPRAAIQVGAADQVLPVDEMPAKLMEYIGQLRKARGGMPEDFREDIEDHLERITAVLRRKTGHDFSRYKRSTLVRRIRRRMHGLHADSVVAYVERLREDPQEVDQLFRDLLIGITHFFRDPEAFDALAARVVPKLFAGKGMDEQVRVWVAGCATGEEAYSIAILLREHVERLEEKPHVHIFATDIDEHALEVARQGWYPESIASQISPARLERFFVRHGNMYQVVREVREMCLFALHNLVADPPFSRLDLMSCRNLLIYLESDLQKKVVPLCHYALRSGGYLFLGPSESVASHSELFRTVDKKRRIFQRKDVVLRPPVSFPLAERGRLAPWRPLPEGGPLRLRASAPDLAKTFDSILLQSYAPPCVVINEQGEVLYFSPRTGKYLEPPAGAPNLNVVAMAREGLRLALRTAIHKAVTAGASMICEDVSLAAEAGGPRVNLIVRPLPELGEDSGLYMVVFQELVAAADGWEERPQEETGTVLPDVQAAVIRRLETELRATKDHLQATLEELESSNEELISSNEELMSINEELQSANEELQTSKEELQSVNEELETVNAELKKKIDELDRAHSDLQNLFRSTQIATVFIDRDLRIQKFTPAATQVFRLIDSDVGRPIDDVIPRFHGDDLVADVKEVLRTLSPQEREVHVAERQAWYFLRILPYRNVEDVIDGVVVTFVDVTELKRAQEQAARLAAIVESSQDAILGKTLDGVVTSWNAGAERMYGYSAAEMVGRPVALLVPPERRAELAPILENVRQGRRVEPFETVRVRKDGRHLDVLLTVSPVLDAQGRIVGASAIARDITDRKRAEAELRRSQRELADFLENASIGLHWVGPDGTILWANRTELEMLGYSREEYVGHNIAKFHADTEVIGDILRRLRARETLADYEARMIAKDGSIRYVRINSNVLWRSGEFVHTRCFTRDVTERRWAEEALREATRRKDEFLALLGHELRNPLAPVRNSVYILGQPNATPEQLERARATIERQVLHLTHLVDDLLDVSRISRGQILLRRERLDLAELVRRELEDHRESFRRAGLELDVELPERPVPLDGDPTRLAQAIGNILHNARKFTDQGGRVTVAVREERARGTAVVLVQDTGLGIQPEVLARLFEPFSQADRSLDRSRGGLGLGLVLVKSLVELHGGMVAVESAGPGEGSAVTLRLPLASAGTAAVQKAEAPAAVGRPRRCLVIEDNPDVAESLRALLELWGHEVEVAHDGVVGVEKTRSFQPDVVLCDIGLPGALDGYAVAQMLREDPQVRSARLIALTGYGQTEDKRRASEVGFDTHLTKPADPERLRRLLVELP